MIERRSGQRGFTLVESLVAIVILVIAVTIGLSLVRERLYTARIRVVAQQFAVHLRAARFAAVSTRSQVAVVVAADPGNTYQYTDVRGAVKMIDLPSAVRIASSSSPITFLANGAVSGGASTVFEVQLAYDRLERWTIATGALGVPRVTHEQVEL